jgi:ASC-1-like (ASCH) protein
MKHIYLKILPEYYEAVKCGDKTFEVRLNDRDYQVNDVLHLQEFNNGRYTGRELVVAVTYILDNPTYCKKGYVIMSLNNRLAKENK